MNIKIKRLFSGVIDFVMTCFLATCVVGIITLVKLSVSKISIAAYLVCFFVGIVLKDMVFCNASLGKRFLKLYIVCSQHNKLDIVTCIKRNATLILFPIEIFLLLFNDFRLGDKLAKTTVVEKES